jgi:hypothetical protein
MAGRDPELTGEVVAQTSRNRAIDGDILIVG